jgi:AraC family transcriptional regulator
MFSRIELLPQKKLIGKHLTMSFAENRTGILWQSFMPRRKEIQNNLGTDLFSIQEYGEKWDPKNVDPHAPFEKWAAIEVTNFDTIPEGMVSYTLAEGSYAVFIHKGPPSVFLKTFSYIFDTWLPQSGYTLHNRPHFEILGEKYKNEHPESEEEVWIPVKPVSS